MAKPQKSFLNYIGLLFKWLFAALCILALAIGAAAYWVYHNQEKIVSLFLERANPYLDAKIETGKIEVEFIRSFPNASLVFNNITIYEPNNFEDSDDKDLNTPSKKLASLKKLSIAFDILKLYKGNYEVEKIYLTEGFVNLRTLDNGKQNWQIYKLPTDTLKQEKPTTELSFTLKDIAIKGVDISYKQGSKDASIELSQVFSTAALQQTPQGLSIQTDTKGNIELLAFGGVNYYKNKAFNLNGSFLTDSLGLKLLGKPTEFELDGSAFTLEGSYAYSTKYIDAKAISKGDDIGHLLSLFPAGLTKEIRKYRSKGAIKFNAICKGSLNQGNVPLFTAQFSAQNASVYHPELKEEITGLFLQGNFTNKSEKGTERLVIKDLKGVLAGKAFEGNLLLENFKNPYIDAAFSGVLSLERLHKIFKIPTVKTIAGEAELNTSIQGYLNEWKNKKRKNALAVSGEVTFSNLSFQFESNPLPFKGFNGTLLFDSEQLAFSNFKGFVGNSDILLNAQLNNLLPKILGTNSQELKLELSINSSYIDVNELVAINTNSKAQQQKGILFVPEGIVLRIGLKAGSVHYKKLIAENVSGTVLLKPKGVKVEDALLNLCGGRLGLNILTDASNTEQIKASLRIDAQNMLMDSVFLVFENFGQEYITHKNVRGRVNVKMESSFTARNNFEPIMPSLKAFINAEIKQGELINFEPIQAIGKYFRRSKGSFNRLQFSNLQNSLIISESVITVPEFSIKANDLELGIQGTHSFDAKMDYRVRIPLRNFRLPDKDEAFGEIAQEPNSDGNLFLKLQGTEGNITVSLDKQATRKRFIENLKKEKEEFLDLWRKPKQENKPSKEENQSQQQQQPTNEEEFFDF